MAAVTKIIAKNNKTTTSASKTTFWRLHGYEFRVQAYKITYPIPDS